MNFSSISVNIHEVTHAWTLNIQDWVLKSQWRHEGHIWNTPCDFVIQPVHKRVTDFFELGRVCPPILVVEPFSLYRITHAVVRDKDQKTSLRHLWIAYTTPWTSLHKDCLSKTRKLWYAKDVIKKDCTCTWNPTKKWGQQTVPLYLEAWWNYQISKHIANTSLCV